MRRARQVGGRGAEEHLQDEAHRISHAECPGDGGHQRQADLGEAVAADESGLGEEHFLGQEAVEQRNAGHRQRGDDRQRTGERHQPAQSAQLAHVTGAGLVVDDAGGHEQGGLVVGLVEDVDNAGEHRHRL
ncbi:hypothetical protein G6F50_017363 [Rhizopus delemar]|uniref:Uncharacterized protein n=1 Tax=Rhizopus delemar TaxID=936053 RepID=A0A9P6XQ91_9FUNG|nr:hypothetical protein G6F50_017363 [Rhizopus delemar]